MMVLEDSVSRLSLFFYTNEGSGLAAERATCVSLVDNRIVCTICVPFYIPYFFYSIFFF